MLEQKPLRRTEVQQQAASLLFEAAGSDDGTVCCTAVLCWSHPSKELQQVTFVEINNT
jgi:hypothetical protein